MEKTWHRREIMKLLAVGGVTFASGLAACHTQRGALATAASSADDDFFFLQLSDTHWGYEGPANPLAQYTLRDTVRIINESALKPRFVMFTGDLVQTTTDDGVRAQRMREFRDIVAALRVPSAHFIPGEHDAALDQAGSYREHFGAPSYAFDQNGVHFIALDNASDPTGGLGEAQLAWLRDDLARVDTKTKIVVFAHRPLFPLEPSWSWSTPDGERALTLLSEHPSVTVFYGHVHQEHHHLTGAIQHHAARSLVFPLPAAGAAAKREALPWQVGASDHGLGYRSVRAGGADLMLQELSVLGGR
jgi:hypothetical protein